MKSVPCKFSLSQGHLKLHRKPDDIVYNRLIATQKSHGRILKQGVSAVESEIVTCYCESKAFCNAFQLFIETSEWDVVSATAIIGQFSNHHLYEDAITLFKRMLLLNINPTEFTFGTVLPSSISLQNLLLGKQLHACTIKMGLQSNVFVGSALLDLYAKLSTIEEAKRAFEDTQKPNVVSYTTLICGYFRKERFKDALRLFHGMPEKNVISWNAIISGYSQSGHNEEAVNLFIEMMREGSLPNQSTFPCAISAASNIAAFGIGKSFHASAIKILGTLNIFVSNSLISFYAKCGSLEDSLLLFNKVQKTNLVSWNALICGYAHNGKGREALEFFRRMQAMGLRPNAVTLLCVLLACSHTGLVDEGISLFNRVKLENHELLNPEHYGCMVDLLSRQGRFGEAEKFIHDLPFDPGIGFWKALLGGCMIHSNTKLGEFAAQKILDLDPNDVPSYVMLSNAHSSAGRWRSVSMIRKDINEKGMKRVPGCSWIEIRNKVHVFLTADRNQEKRDEINVVLIFLAEQLKETKVYQCWSLI